MIRQRIGRYHAVRPWPTMVLSVVLMLVAGPAIAGPPDQVVERLGFRITVPADVRVETDNPVDLGDQMDGLVKLMYGTSFLKVSLATRELRKGEPPRAALAGFTAKGPAGMSWGAVTEGEFWKTTIRPEVGVRPGVILAAIQRNGDRPPLLRVWRADCVFISTEQCDRATASLTVTIPRAQLIVVGTGNAVAAGSGKAVATPAPAPKPASFEDADPRLKQMIDAARQKLAASGWKPPPRAKDFCTALTAYVAAGPKDFVPVQYTTHDDDGREDEWFANPDMPDARCKVRDYVDCKMTWNDSRKDPGTLHADLVTSTESCLIGSTRDSLFSDPVKKHWKTAVHWGAGKPWILIETWVSSAGKVDRSLVVYARREAASSAAR